MRAWLATGLLLFAGAAMGAEDPALAVVEACRARLDARTDIGMARIGRRCPELMPALAAASWRDLLPADLLERRDEISAQSFAELVALVEAAQAAPQSGELPDTRKLAPVLAGLGERGQQGATRWQRFKQWLKDQFERRDDGEEGDSWLEKVSREFETSEGVARVISYTGYALVGLLLAYMIWAELRAAGLLGGVAREARRDSAATQWRRRLQLTDVMQAPLSERPGLLLKLLGEALTRADRLPASQGLTASALVRQARLDSEDERAELEKLARTAEAMRFAPQPPSDSRLKSAVASARSLLEKFGQVRSALRRRED